MRLTSIIVLAVIAAGCGGGSGNSEPGKTTRAVEGKGDFAGLVDIGGGREMYMECQGEGSPTVVFVSGGGDRADIWGKTLDSPDQAVLPAISETNRVCAYDRPGTYLITGDGEEDFKKSRGDQVPQPTTLEDGVSDLHALLGASGEQGPYVVVGHSVGGAVSQLYASEYPRDVSGLVLIDYTPYKAREFLTDKQWELWQPLLGAPSEEALAAYPELERSDQPRNLEQALAAAPLEPMPFIVLSSDEMYDLQPYVDNGTVPDDQAEEFGQVLFQAVLDSRADLVSQVPGARHITNTNSGHYIHQEQPQLVTDAVRQVIEAVKEDKKTVGVEKSTT